MPLIRIDIFEGKPEPYRQKISDAVHRAMVETMNVNEQDRFQIITEHPRPGLVYARHHGSTSRTDLFVFIQITLNAGRSIEMKSSFYERVCCLLDQEIGLRKEDLFISLVEVSNENWFILQ